jgi:UPF0755 protein
MKKSILILLCFLAIGFFSYLLYAQNLKANSKDVVVDFEKGESLSKLASKLEKENLIYSENIFKIKAVVLGYDKGLHSGEYLLNTAMSDIDILKHITKGKVIYHKITIPEGLTVKQIYSIINSNDELADKINLEIKEGYLLPETYSFAKGDSKNSIILQMKASMENSLENIWQNRDVAIDKQIKSKEELLKLASIVEKETILDYEKPIVAKVYLNRLKLRMRLQADPTVIYGAKNYNGDITYKMLKEKNDFNTYTMYGLPKTAIANPGVQSLKAVANPADVDYLYFVADGKGGHIFSKTYEEHKKNVKAYLKINSKTNNQTNK